MHITFDHENDRRVFDYAAIDRALVALGASDNEAACLTDILHQEGWGGIEETDTRNFTEDELRDKLAWLREVRTAGGIVDGADYGPATCPSSVWLAHSL